MEEMESEVKDDGMDDAAEACATYSFVVCVVIIGTICIFGLLGNLTSLCVLVKHKTETVTIFLLQSICVSDSLLLFASIFVYCLPELNEYKRTKSDTDHEAQSYVVIIWPFGLMAHTLTIWLTLLVTFTRYCAVCRPQAVYKAQNVRSTRLQVLAVVVFSVLYNIPRFFEHQKVSSSPSSHSNSTSQQHNDTYLGDNKMYQIVYSNISYFAVMYIVPLVSLTYMNFRLISSLKALRNKKMKMTSGRGSGQNDQITLCVIVIVCVFILCQTPALINQIFFAALSNAQRDCGHFHFYYTKLSDVLVMVNSACNIIIYCLCGKGFRTIFFEAICGHCPAGCRLGNKQEQVPLKNIKVEDEDEDKCGDQQTLMTENHAQL